jgi:hypothetical protein
LAEEVEEPVIIKASGFPCRGYGKVTDHNTRELIRHLLENLVAWARRLVK